MQGRGCFQGAGHILHAAGARQAIHVLQGAKIKVVCGQHGQNGQSFKGRLKRCGGGVGSPHHHAGRKLVGSAQVRKNGVILQHGSLLLHFQPEKLTQLLNVPSEATRQRLTAELTGCVVSLAQVRKGDVDRSCVQEALAAGFSTALGIALQQGALTETERQMSESLAAEKYRRSEWTLRR